MNNLKDLQPNYHKIFLGVIGFIVLVYIGLVAYGFFVCPSPDPEILNRIEFVESTCSHFVDEIQLYIRHVTPAIIAGYLLFLLLQAIFDSVFVPNGLPQKGVVRVIIDLLILLISIMTAYWGLIQIVDLIGSRFT